MYHLFPVSYDNKTGGPLDLTDTFVTNQRYEDAVLSAG